MSALEQRLEQHRVRAGELASSAAALSRTADRISLLRLGLFLGGAVASFVAFRAATPLGFVVTASATLAFGVSVVWHARVLTREEELRCRKAVHDRHILRMTGRSHELEVAGLELVGGAHPYAVDIDLVGPGSLVQRIDTSHTVEGLRALVRALAEPAARELIEARQAAVEELAARSDVREQLETRGSHGRMDQARLDHTPFTALLRQRPQLTPLLRRAAFLLPACALGCWLLGSFDIIPAKLTLVVLAGNGVLLWQLGERLHATLNVVTARLGFAAAYQGMLELLEETPFESPHLRDLKARIEHGPHKASRELSRLARYEGWAQLRTQGPVYLVINVLLLWDLHCVAKIEDWLREVGPETEAWFAAIGELELLCSLATLRHGDPDTCFPSIAAPQAGIAASGLAHPLLDPRRRVANDLRLEGPGSAVIISGSNMAGKSTFLRALGLNTALALAGGPVCARALSLPLVQLRASMRVDDSLQRGASYFHAELEKLKIVARDLDSPPPVLFLLDELLRGTNAKARSEGARAVIEHLLAHGALGLLATHDLALANLDQTHPGKVHNQHFTDVFEHGEMRFDYVLRAGPVRTSNALRLLAMAGIPVAEPDLGRLG